ncbi:MAG: YeeE/YedE family protein [Proteobacteria bacterium]|nr:YeeE/YedE family protein [Pseudomonadota bacterium]MBU1708430.1 YeeE/YedE family protein [Pseudomonadota bacterium]
MEENKNTTAAFIVTGALLLITALYAMADNNYMYLNVYIWFGVAYGLMLQYGRFCFASASRDLFAAGVPRMAVGILVALMFFSVIQAVLMATNMSTFHPAPMGIQTIIAGLIFGVGMVLAGGCASGSLYKIGEGNGTSILSIMGISFGQAFFVTVGNKSWVPQAWIESSTSKAWVPKDKVVSWFDYYLTGFIFDQPTTQLSKTATFKDMGVAKYFIADSLINSIIPALLLIVIIYVFYSKKPFISKRQRHNKKNPDNQLALSGIGVQFEGIWSMITASTRTTIMGVIIGCTAGLHIFVMKGMQMKYHVTNFGQLLTQMGHGSDVGAFGNVFDPGYWYITTQEAQFAGWILDKLGYNVRDSVFFGVVNGLPELWRNPALWMSIGIIFGAMILALLNNEFKFKPPKGELIVWGLVGGTLMGIGSRPGLGCNIGAFFIRAAGGDPGGWVFGLGMVVGGFFGVKFFNWWTERKMASEMVDF